VAILWTIIVAVVAGLLQASPAILTDTDLGDDYYDGVPANLLGRNNWLGLVVTGAETDDKRHESRLQITQVSFVPRTEAGRTIYRIVTTPPDVALLISGVPGILPGAAVTLDRFITLGSEKRKAEFQFGARLYRIRLDFTDPSYCDAVITLTLGQRTQKLFDATEPDATTDPALMLACDDPHFQIHWVGDLDRDGQLDMLVTFSRKYSYHPRQLLLSSAARSGQFVAEVGRYDRYSQ
jgi:hypothetical protein